MTESERQILIKIRNEPHRLGWIMGKTKLRSLHSKWVHHIWHSTESRSLQAHRGSYKSTGIVEVGVPWWLLFKPEARIAICRKTKTDAVQAISVFRNAFRIPEIREIFKMAHGSYPEFETDQADHVSFSFKKGITREGNIDGYGVDSAMTGKHYDIILCDDIIGRQDRYSAAAREATRRFLEELHANIVDPGKPVHHIGTPWHPQDAWGSPKVEGGDWLYPKPLIFNCFDTGILTREQIEEKRRTMTPSLFAANYLLKHQADDSALFAHPKMQIRWEHGIYGPVFAHLDAAFGGDCTSALTIGQVLPDETIQVTGKIYVGHIANHYQDIMEMLRAHRVSKFYMEDNADKGFTMRDLSALFRGAGMGLALHSYHESQNKEAKISTAVKFAWDKLRFCEETDADYMAQVTEWTPEADLMDAPDSLASMLIHAGLTPDNVDSVLSIMEQAYQ